MNKITLLLIPLIMAACNTVGCSGASKAPAVVEPPPPSLTSVEFCEVVFDNLCERAERCEWSTKDECLMFMGMQFAPCEEWTPEEVCPEGTTYNGELAYDCVEPMETLACEQDSIPEECHETHYCLPTE